MELNQTLDFHAQRGYAHSVGFGVWLALIVIDFSKPFTSGRTEFPGGQFSAEMTATRQLIRTMRPRHPVIYTMIAYEPDPKDAGILGAQSALARRLPTGQPPGRDRGEGNHR